MKQFSLRNCCLCSQIAGDPANDLLAKIAGNEEAYKRRVPIETGNFVIIPSVGPLVRGHVILCPKKHVRSLASLDGAYDDEFDALLANVQLLLHVAYGQPVHMFEHGMSVQEDARMLCTVDHAHLHLLPTAVSVLSSLKSHATIGVSSGLAGLREAVAGSEYVYYASPDEDRLVVLGRNEQLPSQYMRQVFAEAIGKTDQWNWREYMNPEETFNTYNEILSAVKGAA